MTRINLEDITLKVREDGMTSGAPVIFSHALGTDMSLWDQIIPLLPNTLRLIRFDTRGHGRSDCPPTPYSMGNLIRDTERLLDHMNIRDAIFVGISMGGMIAQGLAVKRMDQIRALVLSNTAAKIGQPAMWQDRILTVRDKGIEALATPTMERWFSRDFRSIGASEAWRDLMVSQNPEGYAGCCAAIAGTDFYTSTSGLRLPTLALAGSEDGSTPPDLVRETAELIPGSRFHLFRRTGRLPCVEKPAEYAAILTEFLKEIGHV